MDVLQHFILYLNCDAGVVAVLRRVPSDAGQRIPLTYAGPSQSIYSGPFRAEDMPRVPEAPGVDLLLPNGRTEKVIIDTGAAGCPITLKPEIFSELTQQGHMEVLGLVSYHSLLGRMDRNKLGLLSSATLWGCKSKRLTVSESNWNSIPLRYLYRLIVIFDFPNDVMYVRPSQLFNACEAQINARCGRPLLWALRQGTTRQEPVE